MDQNVIWNVKFEQSQPAQSGRIMTLRRALDPLMLQYFNNEPSNFVHFKLFTEVDGVGSDVTQFYPLGDKGGTVERYILSIQPTDSPADVVKRRLINQEGEAVKVFWYKENKLVYGSMVVGGNTNHQNRIRVKTNPDGSLPTKRVWVRQWQVNADVLEIDGFRKSDMGRPVAELIAEGRMGYFFEITAGYASVNRALGGVPDLLCPFWHSDEWMTNNGKAYLPLVACEGYGLIINP